jgi:hypothetical protein
MLVCGDKNDMSGRAYRPRRLDELSQIAIIRRAGRWGACQLVADALPIFCSARDVLEVQHSCSKRCMPERLDDNPPCRAVVHFERWQLDEVMTGTGLQVNPVNRTLLRGAVSQLASEVLLLMNERLALWMTEESAVVDPVLILRAGCIGRRCDDTACHDDDRSDDESRREP